MYIAGSLQQLGNFQTLQKMKLSPDYNKRTSFWKIKFLVSAETKQFNYIYVLRDLLSGNYFFERREYRVANLYNVQKMNNIHYASDKQTKAEICENNVQSCRNNQFLFVDSNFVNTQFSASITGNLILGNFPYFQSEIDQMLKSDVKAILNINNYGEYFSKSINWEIITNKYPNHNIEFIDFLLDNPEGDLCYQEKIQKAVDLLNDMIIKYQKVFLHGTLGNKVTTEIALKYLCKYKHFSWDAAIKFLHYHQIPKNLTPAIQKSQKSRKNHYKRRFQQQSRQLNSNSKIMKILMQAGYHIA